MIVRFMFKVLGWAFKHVHMLVGLFKIFLSGLHCSFWAFARCFFGLTTAPIVEMRCFSTPYQYIFPF